MMVDSLIMAARPVQVSLDEDLLREIDRDPEARRLGRSAFLRNAARLYLRAKNRNAVDRAILRAYGRDASAMIADIAALIDAQSWPDE
jgi:hypothetical protein